MRPPTHEQLHQAVDHRRFGPRMKVALKALLEGDSYRHAARVAGVGFRELHRNALSVPGLREAHLRAWHGSWGPDFPPEWRQHLEGLDGAA